MKLSKITQLFNRQSTPKQATQTNTPIPACYNMTNPSTDTVHMRCSDKKIFKKIIKKIFRK